MAMSLGPTGINIISVPSQGSIFSFELTIASRKRSSFTKGRSDSSTDISQELSTPVRLWSNVICAGREEEARSDVLIVDDMDFNRLVMSQMLSKHSITPDEASSGLQAITLIRKKSQFRQYYRLIIMDLEMAEMDGFTATQEIREMELTGELQLRPIIVACSAHTGTDIIEKCLIAGMDDFIDKPVNRGKLQDLVRKYYETNR